MLPLLLLWQENHCNTFYLLRAELHHSPPPPQSVAGSAAVISFLARIHTEKVWSSSGFWSMLPFASPAISEPSAVPSWLFLVQFAFWSSFLHKKSVTWHTAVPQLRGALSFSSFPREETNCLRLLDLIWPPKDGKTNCKLVRNNSEPFLRVCSSKHRVTE